MEKRTEFSWKKTFLLLLLYLSSSAVSPISSWAFSLFLSLSLSLSLFLSNTFSYTHTHCEKKFIPTKLSLPVHIFLPFSFVRTFPPDCSVVPCKKCSRENLFSSLLHTEMVRVCALAFSARFRCTRLFFFFVEYQITPVKFFVLLALFRFNISRKHSLNFVILISYFLS